MAKCNIKSISILIILTIFYFFACEKKSDTNKQVSAIQNSAVTFYRAGMYIDNDDNRIACYWVNNERIDLTDSIFSKYAAASDILVKDGIIYIKGFYKNKDGNRIFCYWINGERTDLTVQPSGWHEYSVIHTTFSHDGKIYSLGYYLDSYGNQIPCYWINGDRIDLDSTGLSGRVAATRIKVQDGKNYVAGYNYSGSEIFYWTDGERTDLGRGFINSIFVENGIIYTAGYYRYNNYGRDMACYWINGERKALPTPLRTQFSSVESVYIHDEKIYMLGYYSISKSHGFERACYWVNGERTDLTLPPSNHDRSGINSIFIDTDQIYAVGFYDGGLFDKRTACYWVNGKRNNLSTPGYERDSKALHIEVLNGNIYILGSFRYNDIETAYCYWVNGQRTDYIRNKNEYLYGATFTIQE